MITITTLRIQTYIYEKVAKLAAKEQRSINQELCFIIQEYLEMIKWNNKK